MSGREDHRTRGCAYAIFKIERKFKNSKHRYDIVHMYNYFITIHIIIIKGGGGGGGGGRVIPSGLFGTSVLLAAAMGFLW